ncbi:copper amine oxidase N-terminal domain-containing protein [Paenibacillus sinopodophylli]|uniref:copper amine oxidase N-terminal domain-containing protein n=1 Tax=Paenibacillus sinopodophylli TaxID=1837342 RepID=UPI00110CFC57|nr:copper amine oxidase N-terminal domain-containing protein [Paenibacillus sinopodophylli]
MYKKIIGAMVAVSMVVGGTSVMASPGKDLRILPIIVNGHKVQFPDTEPYIDTNGRTMVPVRFVSEKLGGDVTWDVATKTVGIKYKGKNITLPVGSKTVSIDSTMIELDTTAEMYEGRTMVPLRFVSEAMESKVSFDQGAHSVLVSDAAFIAKVAAGTVKVTPWGRQLSGEASTEWNKLSDLPNSFYNVKKGDKDVMTNKEYMSMKNEFTEKKWMDSWAEEIRQYYSTQLNVDYRTITEAGFAKAIMNNMPDRGEYFNDQSSAGIKEYVRWVKKNKVIAKGYADPEISMVRRAYGKEFVRTYFKFMIISATDTSQTFQDNYNVTLASDSFKLQKGVWYGGYSDVSVSSNYANMQYANYKVLSTENMFTKGRYEYSILTTNK